MKNYVLQALAAIAIGVVLWSVATIDFNFIPKSVAAVSWLYLFVFSYANDWFCLEGGEKDVEW